MSWYRSPNDWLAFRVRRDTPQTQGTWCIYKCWKTTSYFHMSSELLVLKWLLFGDGMVSNKLKRIGVYPFTRVALRDSDIEFSYPWWEYLSWPIAVMGSVMARVDLWRKFHFIGSQVLGKCMETPSSKDMKIYVLALGAVCGLHTGCPPWLSSWWSVSWSSSPTSSWLSSFLSSDENYYHNHDQDLQHLHH